MHWSCRRCMGLYALVWPLVRKAIGKSAGWLGGINELWRQVVHIRGMDKRHCEGSDGGSRQDVAAVALCVCRHMCEYPGKLDVLHPALSCLP